MGLLSGRQVSRPPLFRRAAGRRIEQSALLGTPRGFPSPLAISGSAIVSSIQGCFAHTVSGIIVSVQGMPA